MNKNLLSASVDDLVYAIKEGLRIEPECQEPTSVRKHYVYGLQGIADLFGCSKSSAARIKKSGILNTAISQVGRLIVTDADLALDLMNISKKRTNLRGGYRAQR